MIQGIKFIDNLQFNHDLPTLTVPSGYKLTMGEI